MRLNTDAFAETGGSAALTGAGSHRNVIFTGVGARLGTSYTLNGGTLDPLLSLGWEHASDMVAASQSLAFAGGPAFSVVGAPLARNAFAIKAGFDLHLWALDMGLSYVGRHGNDANENAIQFSLATRF